MFLQIKEERQRKDIMFDEQHYLADKLPKRGLLNFGDWQYNRLAFTLYFQKMREL